MARRPEYTTLLLILTVPMLFVIGTVLSVLLALLPAYRLPVATGLLCCVLVAVFVLLAVFFARKRKRAEASLLQEKDRFLSDVAHELKTPLTVIRGSAEVLADGMVPEEEISLYFERILRETDAMSGLISDLLDVSRMRSGRVSLALGDVDLSFLARSVCDSLGSVGARRQVSVTYEERASLPVLLLDRNRIRQLMVILLDNAVKHTPEGGRVTLFCDRRGDELLLGVRDTGHGIASEDLPYVFDRFYKADGTRGGLSVGSGLGLSIAQQIVRLHGGTIDVESEIGKGTCFTARLPLREFKESL